MGRSPCCDKSGLKKGPWTPEEDLKLTQYIQLHGPSNWRNLPKNAGLQRCGKSCRLRWINYLRPDIKRGRFSFEEEETIIQLHSILGNKWSAIAARLPGRTDNEIKNYWNTHIRKRLLRMGIDPITHSPRFDFRDLSSILSSTQLNLSNLLGLQTMLNPEFLTLLSTLLASNHQENPEYILQKIQENQIHNTQMQHMPSLRPSDHQFQIPVPEEVPSTSFLNQIPQLVQTDNMGTGNQNFQENPFTPQNYTLESLNGSQFSFDSVKLKPLLSPTPLNSSSTCINGCTEDERESYCSNMFKFEIPVESFDIDDLM